MASTNRRDALDAQAIARCLIAFAILTAVAVVTNSEAGLDWRQEHSLRFIIAAPLLAFVVPWPRCTWADLYATSFGCAAGVLSSMIAAYPTPDTDLHPREIPFLLMGFTVVWAICLVGAFATKVAHSLSLGRAANAPRA